MKSRPLTEKSKLEKNFETRQLFKRSKNLIDLDGGKTQSILRRMPFIAEGNMINEKINNSFVNTTVSVTQRSLKGNSKQKSRSSLVQEELCHEIEIFPIYKRSRSFSFEKMTSRNYHHNLKYKPVSDERRFNNYQKFKPQTPLFCNFTKMRGKQINQQVKKCQRQEYNTQHLYGQFYLKNDEKMCFVNYKSEKKMKSERIFFSPKRSENYPTTELNPEKVAKGEKIVVHNKSGEIKTKCQQQFYILNGRQHPSQIELRFMNQLNNHWNGDLLQIKDINDFYKSRAKDELRNERIEKIRLLKKTRNNREEMCDSKFFRRFRV